MRVRRAVTGVSPASSVGAPPRRGVSATWYDGTPENPTEAAVLNVLAAYKEAGCDGVEAFGGGSSLDPAKAVAFAVIKDRCTYSNPRLCTADDYVQLFEVVLAS